MPTIKGTHSPDLNKELLNLSELGKKHKWYGQRGILQCWVMCLLSSSLGYFFKCLHVILHSQLILPVSASNGHKVEAELAVPEKERYLPLPL